MSTRCEKTHWYFPTGVQCKTWRILIMNFVEINIHTYGCVCVCVWVWYSMISSNEIVESNAKDGREENDFIRTRRWCYNIQIKAVPLDFEFWIKLIGKSETFTRRDVFLFFISKKKRGTGNWSMAWNLWN